MREIRQEQLLGRNELYKLCHLLRDRHGEELLERLSWEEPDQLIEVFFNQLDQMYTKNTIWSRTSNDKDKHRETKRQDERPRVRTSIRNATTVPDTQKEPRKKSCVLCKGEHWSHQCEELPGMNLKQLKVRKVCPSCLRKDCLLYTSPSPRDGLLSRMPSSA